MSKKLTTNFFLTLSLTVLPSTAAFARLPIDSSGSVNCGKLDSFLGVVQILDAERTQVIDTSLGRPLQCGDWISVEDGRAVITHQNGFQFQVAAHSFVQILDPKSGENVDRDHLALFRGSVEIQAPQKTEVRVASANGRAVFRGSQGAVTFNGELHETHLLVFSGEALLLNRYLPKAPVHISEGRFSVVEPNENRLQPTVPRAIAPKVLADLFKEFNVSESTRESVMTAAKAAQVTRVPKKLAVQTPILKEAGGRSPASVRATPTEPAAFTPVQGSSLPPAQPGHVAWPEFTTQADIQAQSERAKIEVKVKRVQRKPAAAAPDRDWTKKPSSSAMARERTSILKKLSGIGPDPSDTKDD